MPSSALDDYEFGPTLGKGSFGEVKAAINIYTGQEVAIKIVDKSGSMKEEDRHQLREEVRILSLLDHPNIVKLHDVIETVRHAYIVLELIEGRELIDYLMARKTLEEGEARHLFRQIIDGVEHCHSRGVAHRDLKLENLLLDHDNNVKIIDFGLAAEMREGELLTQACGSLHYVAPEILCSASCGGYVGANVDVWSCGVILFALLLGRLPFVGDDRVQLEKAILDGRYSVSENVSDEGQDLMKHMLMRDQHLRIKISGIKEHAWFKGCHDEKGAPKVVLRRPSWQNEPTLVPGALDEPPVTSLLTTTFVLSQLGKPPRERSGGWVRGTVVESVKSWRDSFNRNARCRRVRARESPSRDSEPSLDGALSASPEKACQEQHGKAKELIFPVESPVIATLADPQLLTTDFVLLELGRPLKERQDGWSRDPAALPRPRRSCRDGQRLRYRAPPIIETDSPVLTSESEVSSVHVSPVGGACQQTSEEFLVAPIAIDCLSTDFVMSELGRSPQKARGGWAVDSTAIPDRPRTVAFGSS
eukprot:TRINITY_DN26828_c0_g1_i1.p1 TRINITY_DN26828_c0_g1~~TRINITY_DN26828_c0_g1_i1.p1  ORF type:complete len:532 (+),score=50.42 TRINITY_DN26828_c0_g1_i1:162-1757(+)